MSPSDADAPRLPGPADRPPGGRGNSTALRRWGPLGAILVVDEAVKVVGIISTIDVLAAARGKLG